MRERDRESWSKRDRERDGREWQREGDIERLSVRERD